MSTPPFVLVQGPETVLADRAIEQVGGAEPRANVRLTAVEGCNRVEVTVTVSGMRFVPDAVDVAPVDRLVITLDNTSDQVHDLGDVPAQAAALEEAACASATISLRSSSGMSSSARGGSGSSGSATGSGAGADGAPWSRARLGREKVCRGLDCCAVRDCRGAPAGAAAPARPRWPLDTDTTPLHHGKA